jgi:hypothetical protein
MISKLATTKVAVAAFGAVVLSASGAAAATGHLPDAAQHKVASIASHAGIDLPDSASSTATAVHKAQADTPPGPARGKAVSDAAHAANAARKAAKANPSATTGNATSDAAKAKADAKKAADDNHATTTTSGSPAPTTHGQSDATTHGNSAATTHGQSGQEHPTTTTSTTQP